MILTAESIFHDLRHIGQAALAVAERSLRRNRMRRLMRELKAHHLAQLGLATRDEAAEASRWFWEA